MQIVNYLKSVKSEAKFIKWPTNKTTTYFTVGILIVSAIAAIYLGVLDSIFTELVIKYILN